MHQLIKPNAASPDSGNLNKPGTRKQVLLIPDILCIISKRRSLSP
ncbi:hypothetical protein [Chlorobium phaeobacteroides]|nr:hypothetical protein [Chlorobium phaeobacteroides]